MNIATNSSPKAAVVLPHYAFAAVAFLMFSVLLFFNREILIGHYFHPKLLSITHILVLGWGVMIIFGTLYQLLPVILQVSLYSEILAQTTFALLGTGTIVLSLAFWVFEVGYLMQIGGVLVFTSFICFSINILSTVSKNKEWKSEADFILTSCIWLVATGLVGLLLVFNFRFPFLPDSHLKYLKLHAHLGILGWFLLLIMGVASRLLPMFLLVHNTRKKLLNYCYYLVNLGLLGFILQQFIALPQFFNHLWTGFVLGGIFSFIAYCFDVFQHRIRKSLDPAMKQSYLAVGLLLLPAILVVALTLNIGSNEKTVLQLCLAYGFSIFAGFITAIILGQTFKTLPFIVWMHRYQKWVGKTKTPLPKDLYSEDLLKWQNFSYALGFTSMVTGIITAEDNLLKIGGLLLILTSIFYAVNVFKILAHLVIKEIIIWKKKKEYSGF